MLEPSLERHIGSHWRIMLLTHLLSQRLSALSTCHAYVRRAQGQIKSQAAE